MIYNSLLNNPKTKKYKKNSLSIINKKIDKLDSDISRLYKKYAFFKKERLNQEKDQKTIINRIKYLEDEEKKMRIKCEIQMNKINSLTKKLENNTTDKNKSKIKQKITYNNKSYFKSEINNNNLNEYSEDNISNNSFNNSITNINVKMDNKKKKNNIRLIDDRNDDYNEIFKYDLKIGHNKYNFDENKLVKIDTKKDKKIIIENLKNKLKLNNSLILEKPKNIYQEEYNVDKNDINILNKDYSNIIINDIKNISISNYEYINIDRNKYNPIKHFKTNINKRKKIKSKLKSEDSKSSHKYKKNNSLIYNHKKLNNKNQFNPLSQNSGHNNSFLLSKTITVHKESNNEAKNNNINNLKLFKTIEVKRKKLDNIRNNNDSIDLNKIKKIKIIKKNKAIQAKKNNLLTKKGNDIQISYDFIINDDKIYYNNNNKDIHKNLSSKHYDNYNQNYILIKNEEKLRKIINRNKSVNQK